MSDEELYDMGKTWRVLCRFNPSKCLSFLLVGGASNAATETLTLSFTDDSGQPAARY